LAVVEQNIGDKVIAEVEQAAVWNRDADIGRNPNVA
jgi:hypothetical protein